MKKGITLIAALLAMGGAATASTLTLNAATDTSFSLGANLLSTGFSVTGGWYNVALGLDYTTVAANFVSAGSVTFPYAGNTAYNGFAAGDTPFFNATTTGLAGKNVFWLVSDGGSTGWALLEDTSVQFKAETAIPNTNFSGIGVANYNVFTKHVVGGASTESNVALVPFAVIPEPSAALLGALGALGLLRRRRN